MIHKLFKLITEGIFSNIWFKTRQMCVANSRVLGNHKKTFPLLKLCYLRSARYRAFFSHPKGSHICNLHDCRTTLTNTLIIPIGSRVQGKSYSGQRQGLVIRMGGWVDADKKYSSILFIFK